MLFEFELAVIVVIGKFNCFQNPYAGDPLTKIDWHDYKKIAEDEQRTGTSLYTASGLGQKTICTCLGFAVTSVSIWYQSKYQYFLPLWVYEEDEWHVIRSLIIKVASIFSSYPLLLIQLFEVNVWNETEEK